MSTTSSASAPFGRLLTAMVTPYDEDGRLDLEAAARVATYLVDQGNDGVVVSGTTGESPTTTVDEAGRLLRAVVDAVGSRATVVAGVGTNDTAHSVALAEQAAKAGAHGTLVVTPYYSKPSQEGIAAHVETVADAGGLPIMLYDIPGRTGVTISRELYHRLAAHEHVVAVKDAVGDLARGVRIMSETGLTFYSGDDVLNLGWLTHGAVGLVSVVSHVASAEYAAMIDQLDRGDLAAALDTYRRLVPVVDAVMHHEPGAATAKAGLELLGVLPHRGVRLPLVPASDDLVGRLREALDAAGLLHA